MRLTSTLGSLVLMISAGVAIGVVVGSGEAGDPPASQSLAGPGGPIAEYNPAHEACTWCHGTEGPGGDPTLVGEPSIELLCLSCHGPGGVSTLKADVHDTSGGRQTCLVCHNPHIEPDNWLGGVNLKNVGNFEFDSWPWIGRIATPNSGLRDVVFESRGTDAGESLLHSFADNDADGNGYYDGICETCHTATNHHLNDAPDVPPHYVGETCTNCHTHDSGFFPVAGGSCLGCHASIQDAPGVGPVGGRRAVVAEFPISDPHAHYGVELDDGSCVVCHDQTTHMDGLVDLVDPDSGALISFMVPSDLNADPDLSDFCMGCHDADGASRLPSPLDPFDTGNVVPDVATRFLGTFGEPSNPWFEWYGDFCFGEEGTLRAVNAHHDISDGDQLLSGAKLECLSCHGVHAAGSTQPLVDPFSEGRFGAPTVPWTGTENGFCLSCHDGGNGPADPGFPDGVIGSAEALRGLDSCGYTGTPWYVDFTWTNAAHGLDSKREWAGYSGAPGYELRCLDCHDSHGSYTPENPAGNPYMIRDVVDGTMYVDDGVRPDAQWTGPPWETFGVSRSVQVTVSGATVDWGGPNSLCSVCHADWQAAYSWHDYCSGCQTCHGHGMAYQNYDWGPGNDDHTPCATNPIGLMDIAFPPVHFPAIPPGSSRGSQ